MSSSEDTEKAPRLAAKLAAVMAAVERIPKRGTNEHFNYKFATEADIADAIRKELSERHVILVPSVLGCEREVIAEKTKTYGGETKVQRTWLTTIRMRFTFFDGESSDSITREWMGCGSDGDDKGLYKAMTGGEKFFLLKTFLVPTGDDPEFAAKEKDDKDQSSKGRQARRNSGVDPTAPHGPAPPRSESQSAVPPAGAPAVISDGQRRRLYAMKGLTGWTDDQVKELLKRHGFNSSKDITPAAYDSICKALEVPPTAQPAGLLQ